MRPNGPNIIGASGGSGTRVFARIARLTGLYTGSELNESEDAVRLGGYSDRWIDPYLEHRSGLPPALSEAMRQDLDAVLRDHLAGLDGDVAWGWKEPRSIFLLRFFHEELPGLRFLQVVRDGRDIALSANQNQLRKHGERALGPDWTEATEPVRSIALWNRINLATADYAERELGDRYLRLRFEDLCARPGEEIPRLLAFFELDGDVDALAGEVHPPPTLARWRLQPPDLAAELQRAGGEALARFGYDEEGRRSLSPGAPFPIRS